MNELNKSDMLPGQAAAQWSRPLGPLSGILMALGCISGGGYFVSDATVETIQPWLCALFAVTILLFSVVMFLSCSVFVTAVREEKAGYTTTGGMSPHVPQLDYRTGKLA